MMRTWLILIISTAIALLSSTISFNLYAAAQINFYGTLGEVLTPSSIKVVNDADEAITLHLQGPLFDVHPKQKCRTAEIDSVQSACGHLRRALGDLRIGIVFERYEKGVLYGDVVYEGNVLSEELIRNGYYRIDAKHSRAQHLLNAEREALCKFKGIWEKYKGIHEYASICQAR